MQVLEHFKLLHVTFFSFKQIPSFGDYSDVRDSIQFFEFAVHA